MSPAAKAFTDWELDSAVAEAISSKGWTTPTEIQLEAIPVARKGRDVVGPVSYTHLTLPTKA